MDVNQELLKLCENAKMQKKIVERGSVPGGRAGGRGGWGKGNQELKTLLKGHKGIVQ